MIDRIKHAVFETPFLRRPREYANPLIRLAVWIYRLIFYTVVELFEHKTMIRSAALTYYTLTSIVPVVALVFAVMKGVGFVDHLLEDLYGLFPQNRDIVDYIVVFAEKTLSRTRGGLVAAVGFVVLFWSVIRIFSSIESAFNNIWEVERTRSVARQWLTYVGIVIIAPVLWGGAEGLGIYLYGLVAPDGSTVLDVLAKVGAVILIWLLFTILYKYIPYTHVHWRSALTGGIAAGTAFLLFQWGYIYLQSWMTSYNAIYGSFAALPLFLLWLQISWQILLVGGELAYAHQHIEIFDAERREMLLIPQDFRKDKNGYNEADDRQPGQQPEDGKQ